MTCTALLAAGCGGPAWAPAAAVADPSMVTGRAAPRTIDVLPLDVEVWSEEQSIDNDQLRMQTEAGLVGAITGDMYKRGLQVGAVMDWTGNFIGADGQQRNAMTTNALGETINSLARYGERIPPPPAELPIPYLPERLGVTTGADATLYVGGWGFAAKHHDSTGMKIAEGIGIVLIAAVVVVVVIAMAKGGGSGGSGLGNAAGAVAQGAGKVAVSAGRAALQVAGNIAINTVKVAAEVENDSGLVSEVIDAMGHAHAVSEAQAAAEHPDWSTAPNVPHHGSSAMFVEMTLVDNHTGLVLWHAQQRFPADPRHTNDVARAARVLLASFPTAPHA